MSAYPKSIILILTVFCFLTANGQKDSEGLLLSADEAMTQQKYGQAIADYESLVLDGYSSSELFFNLGSAYHHNGEVAKAILNLERASKLAPRNPSIRQGLKLAREKLEDPVIPVEPFFLSSAINHFRDIMPAGWWAFLSIVFLWILVVLINDLMTERKIVPRRFQGLTLAVIGFLFASCLVFAIARNQFENDNSVAIMMNSDGALYEAPATTSELLQRVEEGEKVRIMKKLGEWVEIELENRDRGWTIISDIESI